MELTGVDKPIRSEAEFFKLLTMVTRFGKSQNTIKTIRSNIDNVITFVFFTAINAYNIRVKLPIQQNPSSDLWTTGYIGGGVSSRMPRPGENYCRGRDLADGPCTYETFLTLLGDIVSYEMVHLAQDAGDMHVEETTELEGRFFYAGTSAMVGGAKMVFMTDSMIGMNPIHWQENCIAMPAVVDWHKAPAKTEWGDGMYAADVELGPDETFRIFCDKESRAMVEKLILSPPLVKVDDDATDPSS